MTIRRFFTRVGVGPVAEEERFAEIIKVLDKIMANSKLDPTDKTWVQCATGRWTSSKLTPTLQWSESEVQDTSEIGQIQFSCYSTEDLGAPTPGSGSTTSGGYEGAVERTKQRVEESIEQCKARQGGPQSTVASDSLWSNLGEAWRAANPYKVAQVMVYVQLGMMKGAQWSKESAEQGLQDRVNGLPPQKPNNPEYMKFYNMGDKSCTQAQSCKPVEPPKPPESPRPETPKPEPTERGDEPGEEGEKGMGDSDLNLPPRTSTAGDCFDDTECTSCRSREAAWRWFEAECEKMNWRSYTCKAAVAVINGCVSPAEVNPHPDAGYQCRAKATDEEAKMDARIEGCEKRGGLMMPAPDGSLRCDDAIKRAATFEDAMGLLRRRICLYANSDRCDEDVPPGLRDPNEPPEIIGGGTGPPPPVR